MVTDQQTTKSFWKHNVIQYIYLKDSTGQKDVIVCKMYLRCLLFDSSEPMAFSV